MLDDGAGRDGPSMPESHGSLAMFIEYRTSDRAQDGIPEGERRCYGIPAVTAYLKGVPGATSFAASLNSTFISIPFFIIDPRTIGTDKPLFGCADPACDL